MEKIGRNDPCPCGSGKKFKKCCESQMLGGKFKATRVEAANVPLIQKTLGMSALFQSRLAETPKKPMPPVSEMENSPVETPAKNPESDQSLEKKEDI